VNNRNSSVTACFEELNELRKRSNGTLVLQQRHSLQTTKIIMRKKIMTRKGEKGQCQPFWMCDGLFDRAK
jgi:hypothetical protein